MANGEDEKVLGADDGDVVRNASVLNATALLYTENGKFYIMCILPSLPPPPQPPKKSIVKTAGM